MTIITKIKLAMVLFYAVVFVFSFNMSHNSFSDFAEYEIQKSPYSTEMIMERLELFGQW